MDGCYHFPLRIQRNVATVATGHGGPQGGIEEIGK